MPPVSSSRPCVPCAVLAERDALPPAVREAIRPLLGPRPAYFVRQLTLAWGVILVAIALAEWIGTWWATLLAILVIATRQNVLALLVHEQAHCLGFKPPRGDLIANLFAAYPLLFLTVEGYARVHLTHHTHFFTERDPDHLRKSGDDWAIPMSVSRLARLLVRDVLGLNVIRLVRGKKHAGAHSASFSRKAHPAARPAFLIGLVILLTLTGTWQLFLLYWLLPLLTVFQVIVRWGALAEHQYNLPGATVAESTPLIEPSWLDRLLLPNLNFSLHVYHHDFPGVSASNLPALHRLYREAGLVDEASVFRGNLDYLRFILGRPRSAHAPTQNAQAPT